jgi:adenylate kinase family enzyme
MLLTSENFSLNIEDWPALPNILSAKEFQNLPPNAKTCIIIEGMTRSGRYTQAITMSEDLNLNCFAFTDWLAKYKPENEAEKEQLETVLKKGSYLSSELSIKIADWALESFFKNEFTSDDFYNRPFVCVGYPRTIEQAAHFQQFLEKHNVYGLMAVIETNEAESKLRMQQKPVDRIGHETDHIPEVQMVKIGEYYLKTHGFLKWLALMNKATVFKVCIDKKEYNMRPGDHLSVIDRGDYVVISPTDVSKMIMMFLNMVHFINYSGA